MSDKDKRIQEGYAPEYGEKGMSPQGEPLFETPPAPPKPNDAATSARPSQASSSPDSKPE